MLKLKPGDVIYDRENRWYRYLVTRCNSVTVTAAPIGHAAPIEWHRWYVDRFFAVELGSLLEDSDDAEGG